MLESPRYEVSWICTGFVFLNSIVPNALTLSPFCTCLSMPKLINRMVWVWVHFTLNVRCGGRYPLQDLNSTDCESWLVRNFLFLFLLLDFLKRLRFDMPTKTTKQCNHKQRKWNPRDTDWVEMHVTVMASKGEIANPGGGYSQTNWVGVCSPLPKPLPYLWPKSAIFPTLFMTWPTIWYSFNDLTLK